MITDYFMITEKSNRLQVIMITDYDYPISDLAIPTPDRQQSKTLILLTNVDQTLLETEFSIAISRPTGDKWQWKSLFSIYDPCLSIVKSVFNCHLSGVIPVLH